MGQGSEESPRGSIGGARKPRAREGTGGDGLVVRSGRICFFCVRRAGENRWKKKSVKGAAYVRGDVDRPMGNERNDDLD
jgi:hypothetical protein